MFLTLASFAKSLPTAGVKIVFFEKPPKIDGHLDDDAWKEATVIDQFWQREPNPGAPVSEKTVAYIGYDHEKIYFAFRCYESNPKNITAKELARDVSLGEDDRVQIILDTFLDQRTGYWFQVGPRGSIGDALLSENGATLNKDWDGLWEGKAHIHKEGWDVEMAIPFKTLNFKRGSSRWGLKLLRNIRRKSEVSYWPVANLDTYRFQVSDCGILEGLEGITQGKGLELNPYALTGFDQKPDSSFAAVGDAGGELFYQINPGLKSAVTLNTDFAQTEADARQINLTRFPLFFPEKRDFFLAGANYFSFGPSGTQLIPFFSRRIGLDIGGNPISILGGGKIHGQNGPWSVGFLDAVDDRSDHNQNFTVVRLRRNLWGQSSIGMIATSGNALSDEKNLVGGMDLKLATSSFQGNRNLEFSLFGLKSSTQHRQGQDGAIGTELSYPNDFLNFRAGFLQIDPNFSAGVGFVPRPNIRESYLSATLGPRPHHWHILQAFVTSEVDYITDLRNQLQSRTVSLTPFYLRFQSADEISAGVSRQYEFLSDDFRINPAHNIPAGSYEFTRQWVRLMSAQRRRIWASFTYRWGSFYDGFRRDRNFSFGYKVRVPFYVGMETEQNQVRLQDGNFTVNVARLNANILFSPNVTLYNFLQYDNLSRLAGWQSRFRWIIKPGNEIYFVWNSRILDPLNRFDFSESSARLKLRYNYRF